MRPKNSILFVEDDTTILHMMEMVLDHFGYKVTPAVSPDIAMELFSDDCDAYDLVITDYNMPEMDGQELVNRMREIRSDIPVILCSGSDLMMRDAGHRKCVDHFINKPYDIDKFKMTIEEVLEQSQEMAYE